MSAVAGLILAGGRSARMGGDKGLKSLAGQPIASMVVARLRTQVDRLVLSANGDPARFAFLGLPVIADTIKGFAGPLAGVLSGMKWSRANGFAQMVTVPTDSPFFPQALVERFAAATGPEAVAIAQCSGRTHAVFALWPTMLEGRLADFLQSGQKASVLNFVRAQPHVSVDFDEVELPGLRLDPFFNINTPGDLVEAERIAALLP